MSTKRIFHDPIHKEIVFDSGKSEELMIMELIDTSVFQRPRRIKQLGAASLLFHGAERADYPLNWRFLYSKKNISDLIEINLHF